MVWSGEVAGSMRAGALPGERKLLRRTPLRVQPYEADMHPNSTLRPVSPVLSIRVDESNPDHHLWCNHGVYWIHYVVHEGNRKRRVRHSLRTRELLHARQLRDAEFARVQEQSGLGVAAAASTPRNDRVRWDACA